MSDESDFQKISEYICSNQIKHEQQIKDFCINSEVCSIGEFLNGYQEEVKTINAETTPSKDWCINSFKEIFHTFENYPVNIQKPKKNVSKELNRTLSNSKCQLATDQCSESQDKDNLEKGPSTAKIYNEYKKFKQCLTKLENELKQRQIENNYTCLLLKLNELAKDMEKVCSDKYEDATPAYNDEDTESLSKLVTHLEKALYITDRQHIFEESYVNDQLSWQNLDSLVEILDYWLNSIGHFKDY